MRLEDTLTSCFLGLNALLAGNSSAIPSKRAFES